MVIEIFKISINVQYFKHCSQNKILVIRGWNSQMRVRTANREDHDQTASSEAV